MEKWPEYQENLIKSDTITLIVQVNGKVRDTIEVKTVGGVVKVKVPAGTQPGALVRIKGKGVVNLRGGHGDHYVRVRLEIPKSLSAEEKKLYEQLGSIKGKKKWF